jgi:RNA polymerase primary sigma factor
MAKTFDNASENAAFNTYMSRARKAPMLSPADELQLANLAKSGGPGATRAQHTMITAHLRLVLSVAWKQVRPNFPLEDLVQEGNLGLMRALEKFEPERGFRFSTYAQWWVRQSINEYLKANGNAVRIPPNKTAQITKMNAIINRLSANGNLPSDAQVAAEMDIPVKLVRELAQYATAPISLNTPVFDGDAEFGDRIEDTNAVNPEAKLINDDMVSKLTAALSVLNERERDVVTRRFGLDGDEQETLDELSRKYGVTRERIRQIEVAALKKLKGGDTGRMLKSLL